MRAFYLAASHRQTKQITSLRPRRLCGEISILDKSEGIFVSGRLGEERFLQELAQTCTMLEPSYEAAKIGGEIYAGLKKEGRLINDADILIASIVKAHDAVLVTNNLGHFSRIQGLKVENWLK
jgi:predicted nucleic acid-binding protein